MLSEESVNEKKSELVNCLLKSTCDGGHRAFECSVETLVQEMLRFCFTDWHAEQALGDIRWCPDFVRLTRASKQANGEVVVFKQPPSSAT